MYLVMSSAAESQAVQIAGASILTSMRPHRESAFHQLARAAVD
jgi:hypothetical protein